MAIKLYSPNIRPTDTTSAVETTPNMRISQATATQIGNAISGVGKTATQLFRKYEIRKSENEVLEKERQLIEGNENFKGISEVKLEASKMTDPDAAKAFYQNGYNKAFEGLTQNYKHNFTKDLFKSVANKHFLKDSISVTNSANKNFAIHSQGLELSSQNKLSKDFVYAETTDLQMLAEQDANNYWNSEKVKTLYGANTEALKNAWFKERDIAYAKRLVPQDRTAGISYAKKSKYLDAKDVQAIEKYRVGVAKENKQILKTSLKEKENSITKNFEDVTNEEYASMLELAKNSDDPILLQRLQDLNVKRELLSFLKTQNRQELNNLISTSDDIEQQDRIQGVNTSRDKKLRSDFIKSYTANFVDQIEKDPIGTASKLSFYDPDSLPISDVLQGGDISEFVGIGKKRVSIGTLISLENNAPKRFFTNDERSQLTNYFDSEKDPANIERVISTMSLAFGSQSDEAFAELGQNKNGQFFGYLGGLSLITNNNEVVKNALIGRKLSDDGFKATVPSGNVQYSAIVSEYKTAFIDNPNTFTAAVNIADYIYTKKIFDQKGKKADSGSFNASLYEEALQEAIGQENGPDGKKVGGTAETSRGYKVHVPNFIKQDDFSKIEQILSNNPNLLQKAANNKIAINTEGKPLDIFKNENPHFVSVGYGKYIVFLGDHPTDNEPNLIPVLNGLPDGKLTNVDYFKINLNLIKDDLILELKRPNELPEFSDEAG